MVVTELLIGAAHDALSAFHTGTLYFKVGHNTIFGQINIANHTRLPPADQEYQTCRTSGLPGIRTTRIVDGYLRSQ
jgi:hypothetical protein